MDFFALAANARQALEQAGADISQQATRFLENPGRAAEDAKRITQAVITDVSQAAANFDLGKTAQDARHAADMAVQQVEQACAQIDLSGAAFGIQESVAASIKTIHEGFSRINIEQILTNAQIDAEKIANEVSNNIDLPGAVRSANQWVEKGFTLTKLGLSTFELRHTVNGAMLWVEAHPIQTALLVANLLLLLAPQLLNGPLLALAGFGTEGVGAGNSIVHINYRRGSQVIGSLAAAWQADAGPIPVGSLFAGLQSAGAAGYGLSIVNGIVQSGAGIAELVIIAIEAAEAERKSSEKSKLE